jgi:2OG-Fe(II) oxygenase superfamily
MVSKKSTAPACLMMFAIAACSSSAFKLSSFSGQPTHLSSPLVLSAKPKTKSAEIKQNTRVSGGGGGGGGGFGTTTTTSTNGQDQQPFQKAKTKTGASYQSSSSSSSSSSSRRMSSQPQRRLLSAIEAARQNTAAFSQQQEQQMELSETESEEWKSRLTEEYRRQQEQESSSKMGQLVQVSQDPLLFTIDGFVDPAACRKIQNDGAGCFHLFYPEKLSVLFNGQENEMDGLLFTATSSQEHRSTTTADKPYPHGLHMDTNNQCLFRHVTCILYLNDIPEECGGATVFPLARCLPNDPALAASRRFLYHKLSHTRNHAAIQDLGLVADAALMESRVGTNYLQRPETDTAIRIQPKAGRLLVFFSRDAQGHEDPRAWHGGERIRPCANGSDGDAAATIMEKRILTLFKEVEYDYETKKSRFQQVESTLESFLAPLCKAQRNWLQAKATLQRVLQ